MKGIDGNLITREKEIIIGPIQSLLHLGLSVQMVSVDSYFTYLCSHVLVLAHSFNCDEICYRWIE